MGGPWAIGKEQQPLVFDESKKINAEEQKHQIEKEKEITAKVVPVRKEGIDDLVITNAHSSIIIDGESGTIMQYGNGKERRQIASLTKVMTALLVMENVKNLDESVTITEESVYVDGTKIGCPRSGYCPGQRLKIGEQVAARDLLKAMLMNSANDAATALAIHVSGTTEKFVRLMNERAKQMGLIDSNFCTPSGLETEGRETECYSSAYDIAKIAAYSLKYDLIWDTFRLPNNTTIYSVDGKIKHDILNTDLVMDQIPNLLGGKTGFTPLAGKSLLMAVTDSKKQHKVVAVLLDDPYRWEDIRKMFEWVFDSYEWK